jgi:hypothetical protein
MKAFKNLLCGCAIALSATLLASIAAADNITYSFVSAPDLVSSGTVLAGTVTTDGHIGVLAPSDILAWGYFAKYPDGFNNGASYGSDSSMPNALVLISGTSVTATASGIYVDYPAVGAVQASNELSFCVQTGDGSPLQELDYVTASFPAGYFDQGSPSQYANWIQAVQQSPHIYFESGEQYLSLPTTPFLAATVVPEPSTLVLLSIAAVGWLRYVWRRRRQMN